MWRRPQRLDIGSPLELELQVVVCCRTCVRGTEAGPLQGQYTFLTTAPSGPPVRFPVAPERSCWFCRNVCTEECLHTEQEEQALRTGLVSVVEAMDVG